MHPETLFDAYLLFVNDSAHTTNCRLVDNLRTALRHYVLLEMGFTTKSLRANLDTCMNRVHLKQFVKVDQKFEASAQTKSVKASSIRTYRMALNRFLDWLNQQPWFARPAVVTDPNRAPNMRTGRTPKRSAEERRLLSMTFETIQSKDFECYRLKKKEASDALISQLEDWKKFWTDLDVPTRKCSPLQAQVVTRGEICLYGILGWLSESKGIDVKALSLSLLVELETIKEFVDLYLNEKNKNYHWASEIANVISLVAKFLNPHSKRQNFADIPCVEALRLYIYELNSKREDIGEYSLKEHEKPKHLQDEYQSFKGFWLDEERPERKKPAIVERTYESYADSSDCFLGWKHHYDETALEELHLIQFTDINTLKKFIAWGINTRKNGYGWAVNIAHAALAVAKWANPQAKRHNFGDIESVQEIRDYKQYLRQQNRSEEPRQNLDLKRVTFQEAQLMVDYLKLCCAPLDQYGDERGEDAVMAARQRYLIVALLTYCPVRQREIRELELNKTLFREADGYWVKLGRRDHKAGRRSRKGREYPLPKNITEALDQWLKVWRPKVITNHQIVFVSLGANRCPETRGMPFKDSDMGRLVKNAINMASSNLFDKPRDTTPHIYRRVGITFQRRYGRPEQQAALAELMGHSLAEAERTYNEESLREKSAKAEGWWELNPQSSPSPVAPVPHYPPTKGWHEGDDVELHHLSPKAYQNQLLKQARDRAVIVLWALHEVGWAQMTRLNLAHLRDDEGQAYLDLPAVDGDVERTLVLKPGIAEVLTSYIGVRTKCEGQLEDRCAPLLISVGNRAGGQRITPGGIRSILTCHLGIAPSALRMA